MGGKAVKLYDARENGKNAAGFHDNEEHHIVSKRGTFKKPICNIVNFGFSM